MNTAEPEAFHLRFERTRAQQPDGSSGEDYDVNPMQIWNFRYMGKKFPRYHEFHVEFLVRTHPKETGLFSLKLESQAYTVLTEVTFIFQAGRAEPWVRGRAKGVKASYPSCLACEARKGTMPWPEPIQIIQARKEKRIDRGPEKSL